MTTAIDDTRALLWANQAGRCARCGTPLVWATFQLAHRIPQRRWCIKRWGRRVIHHPFNLAAVCGLECNAAVQLNPDGLPAERLAAAIRRMA